MSLDWVTTLTLMPWLRLEPLDRSHLALRPLLRECRKQVTGHSKRDVLRGGLSEAAAGRSGGAAMLLLPPPQPTRPRIETAGDDRAALL